MSKYVNGVTYGWADIALKIPGLELELQSIDYGDELEKEASYGMGQLPKGYGRGNYKATCKLGMLMDDYEQLSDWCKSRGNTLYGLMIDKIVVNYAAGEGRIHTDIINDITITKVDNKAAQGDKTLPIDIECLVVGQIIRDGLRPI